MGRVLQSFTEELRGIIHPILLIDEQMKVHLRIILHQESQLILEEQLIARIYSEKGCHRDGRRGLLHLQEDTHQGTIPIPEPMSTTGLLS